MASGSKTNYEEIEVEAIDIDNDVMDFADLGFATQTELDAYIQEGLDSIKEHGTIPHVVVMAEMRAMIAKYRA